MTTTATTPQKRGLFYGWWIVLSGTIIGTLGTGVFLNGMTAFIGPMSASFGWPRTVFSFAVSLSRLSHIITSPIFGVLVDRIGPRRLLWFGIPWLGLGFILLGFVNSTITFYIVFLLFISIGSSTALGPVNVAVGNWFIRKRGRALGLVSAGLPASAVLVYPLTIIMAYTNWQTAAVLTGVLLLVICLPLTFLIRHKPEPYGYLPDGDTIVTHVAEPGKSGGEAKNRAMEVNLSPRTTLRTPAFWTMSIAFGIRHLGTHGIALHLLPMIVASGVPAVTAGAIVAFFGVLAIPSRIGIAWLGDIFQKRYVMAATTLVIALSFLWGSQMSGLWPVVIFVALYAPAYGGAPPLMSAMIAEYFGRRHLGATQGMLGTITTFGQAIGPLFMGFMYDATDSYQVPLLIYGILNLGGAVILYFTKRPLLDQQNEADRPRPETAIAAPPISHT